MKQYFSKALFYTWALILITAQPGCAQPKGSSYKFINKEIDCWDFHSAIIGEDYTIYVHVPPGYDTSKTAYPLFYLTDGDWDKAIAIDAFNMLRQDYITQEAVIVGIGYGERPNQRDRDLEPKKGAANFLAFIEKELIPFIAGKYRITNGRTLSGYSYGGLFAAYALFNRPGLFNTVCIGAPAFSDNLLPYALQYFAAHKDLKTRIFMGVGAYEHGTIANIAALRDYLLKRGCTAEADSVSDAGHGAAKPKVIQDGVAFAFCRKHKAITLPVTELEKYSGTYSKVGSPDKRIAFYVKNGKLYGSGGVQPIEIVPFTPNGGFFIYENEKADMLFRTENGKMYELYVPYGGKQVRFDKVN